MGGGESSAPPTDLLGGQYASFSGGTPLPDYSALGQGVSKGMQQFGSAIANQPQQNYMTGATIPQQQNYQGASLPPTLIPSVQELKQNSKDDLAELIRRFMKGGDAKYWYVDPNASGASMPQDLIHRMDLNKYSPNEDQFEAFRRLQILPQNAAMGF